MFDAHGSSDGNDEVPDGNDTVDQSLVAGARDANTVKDLVQVVGNETVSRPLREDTNANNDPQAAKVTRGTEEVEPGSAFGLSFELNGFLDFVEFEVDERVILFSSSVVLGENPSGLSLAAFADQPSRGFWDQPDEQDLDDGGQTLEN